MAKKKCPICEQQGEEQEMTKVGSRWYHNNKCLAKKQAEAREGQDYKDLIMYLCQLCDIEEPMPAHLSYIKKLREDYKMKSRGIMLTVQYYYEKLNHPIKDKSNLLGIVVYKYEEARLDYIESLELARNTRDFINSGKKPIVQGECVHINPRKIKERVALNSKKTKKIDISKILEGEENE